MNVFILDDDENIVQALCIMIERSGLPLQKTIAACSPLDALDQVAEQRPDIILTDIRMPGMDGLAFIDELKRRGIRSKVLFMSGYKDFEYASEAIRLGAHDYLVKPFNEQRLVAALTSVMEVIRQESKSRDERETLLKKSMYHSLTTGHQWELDGKAHVDSYNRHISKLVYYVLHIELRIPDDSPDPSIATFEAQLRVWERRALLPRYGAFLLYSDVRRIAVVCSIAEGEIASSALIEVWSEMKGEMERELGVIANVGVSGPQASVSEVPKGFQEAYKAAQRFFFSGRPGLYVFDSAVETGLGGQGPIDKTKIVEALMLGKREEAEQMVIAAFDRLRQHGSGDKQAVLLACRQLLQRVGPASRRADDWREMETFETLAELQEWMLHQLSEAVDYAWDTAMAPDDRLVAKVKAYCLTHIGEDLTLQQVAEFAGYNKAYFSSFFKKKTGSSFWDYLTGIRIDRAKELLEHSQLNVYEIGTAVGYSNPSHFGKIFKQAVGCTPAEYKLSAARLGQ